MEDLMLSVVVPVYKAEQYLDRCLKSILKTSYSNIEVILVDDGSPDRSPEICDYYADIDDRVKVIHQQNAGGGFARNSGIKVARGEYIAFCDNDDLVPVNAYSVMMECAKATKADVIRGTVERIYEDTGENRLWERSEDSPLHTLAIGLLGGIYKAQFLKENNLLFTNLNMGPDVYFMIQAIDCANNVQYISDVTYHYMMRKSDSIETSAMQKADKVFSYYFDDFLWRKMALEYINQSHKLYNRYHTQLSYFCKRVDENWFRFDAEQRKKCFDILKDTVSLISWKEQEHDVRSFIHVTDNSFSKMSYLQYEGILWIKFKIYKPIYKMIKNLVGRKKLYG